MPTLKELRGSLDAKRTEIKSLFDSNKTDKTDPDTGNPIFKDTFPIAEYKSREKELNALTDEYDAMVQIDTAYQKNNAEVKAAAQPNRTFPFGDGGGPAPATKSFEKLFTDSPEYKTWKERKQAFGIDMNVSLKTLFSEAGGGYVPYPVQQPTLIYSPQRRLVVADLIPQADTDAAFIIYMEETGFSNAAAAVAEGAVKPESADAFTRRTVPMTKIATTLPITDEQASDVPQIEDILRNRLGFMVQLEEERELLAGNPGGGNASEQTGFLNKSGVLTVAKGSLDTFTACLTAITRIQSITGFADPSAFVFHPTDWLNLRTIKDTMGRFIMGNPDQTGPERLWGLPIVRTIAEPLGTILTGDFRTYAHIDRRWGLRVDVGYVNDDFTRNQAHLRAEERLCLEIYRASAFSLITGV